MTQDRFRELIVEMASPEGLQGNPFRVLDLPTDVSTQVLRREAQRLELLQRLSDGAGTDATAATDAGRLQDALRRLRDPAGRLVYELLWFWPDDVDGASDHNTAIATLHGFADRDAAAAIEVGELVVRTMTRSLDTDATAAHLARRAEALDDPRIGASDVDDLVVASRLLVPLLALRKAVRAHQSGDSSVAAGLAAIVRDQPGIATGEAAGIVLAPVFERLRAAAATAAVEAGHTPSRAIDRAQRLLDETRADREVVDLMVDASDPRRLGVIDQLVELGRICAVATFNESRGSATVVPFLRTLGELGPGPAALSKLDDTITHIEDLLRQLQQAFISSGDIAARLREAGVSAAPAGRPSPYTTAGSSTARERAVDKTDVMIERFFAYLVDYLLISWTGTATQVPLLWVLVFVLDLVVLQGLTGYTVGKRLISGIRAASQKDGGPPGLVRATIRSLPWVAAGVLATAFGTGATYVIVAAIEGAVAVGTTGHRRIGDMLAGTLVVLKSTPRRVIVPPDRSHRPLAVRLALPALVLGLGAVLAVKPDWDEGDEQSSAVRRTDPSDRATATTTEPPDRAPATTAPATTLPHTTTTSLRPPVAGECARPAPTAADPSRYVQVACDDPSATVQLMETQPGFASFNTCAAGTDVVLEYTVTEYINGVPMPRLPETWCMRNL